MADVFISYSRHDAEFVQRLNNAFVSANRVVWIDWQSIARGEDWWREIQSGIESADVFICVLTENWLTSSVCHDELAYARQKHKRVIPLIRQRIEADIERRAKGSWMDQPYERVARENWEMLRHLQWVFFDKDERFTAEFAALLESLEVDQPYLKAHTRYLNRALEWERSNRNPSYLLEGDELIFAEAWLAEGQVKEPPPSQEHHDFIAESRRAEDENQAVMRLMTRRTRQFRQAAIGLMAIAAVAVLFTIWAGVSARNARRTSASALNAQNTAIAEATEADMLVLDANQRLTEILLTITALAEDAEAAEGQAAIAATERQNAIDSALTVVADQIIAETQSAARITTADAAQATAGWLVLGAQFEAAVAENVAMEAAAEAESAATAAFGAQLAATAAAVEQALIEPTLTGVAAELAEVPVTLTAVAENAAQAEAVANARIESAVLAQQSAQLLLSTPSNAVGASLLAIRALNTAYTDYADAALTRALDQQLAIGRLPHNSPVISTVFSRDGSLVITASGGFGVLENNVTLWNGETQETVLELFFSAEPTAAVLSPDEQTLLTATTTGEVLLWSLAEGEVIRNFSLNDGQPVTVVAFSGDGARVLTASGNSAWIWDTATGEKLFNLAGDASTIRTASFSPDLTRILTTSEAADGGEVSTAMVWDAASGERLLALDVRESVQAAGFTPDGTRIVTGSSSGVVMVWDAITGTSQREFSLHLDPVQSLAFSPGGAFVVTGDTAGRAFVSRLNDGASIRLIGHTAAINAVAFNRDGSQIVTASEDGTAIVWDAASGEALYTLRGHTGPVNAAAFHPTRNRVMTASGDGTALVWSFELGRTLGQGQVTAVGLSPDGTQSVTGMEDGTVSIGLYQTGNLRQAEKVHTRRITSVEYAPGGSRFVTASGDGTAIVWDATSGEMIHRLEGHTLPLTGAIFSPDGSQILTMSWDTTAIVWDADTGDRLYAFEDHTGWITSAAFNAAGDRLALGSLDHTVSLWDMTDGTRIRSLTGHTGPVNSVAFSPDGRLLATAGDDAQVLLWNVETLRATGLPTAHTDWINSVAFSPDGRLLVTASWDNTAVIWDVAAARPLYPLQGHTGPVWRAEFSPDGRRILTASQDTTAVLWETASYRPVRTVSHPGPIWDAAFSSDGQWIITLGADGTARLWETDYRDFIAYACSRMFRDLTAEERVAFNISANSLTCGPIRTEDALEVYAGSTQGTIEAGGSQVWAYEGRAGETLSIDVIAAIPAQAGYERNPDGLDTIVRVYSPDDLRLLAENDNRAQNLFSDSRIEGLTLPDAGVYYIAVEGWGGLSGGGYTLIIGSDRSAD
jgi:WD40 repeat protein